MIDSVLLDRLQMWHGQEAWRLCLTTALLGSSVNRADSMMSETDFFTLSLVFSVGFEIAHQKEVYSKDTV